MRVTYGFGARHSRHCLPAPKGPSVIANRNLLNLVTSTTQRRREDTAYIACSDDRDGRRL